MHVVVPDARLALFRKGGAARGRIAWNSLSDISIVESNFIGSHEVRQTLTLILDLHEANEGSEYKAEEFLAVTY